MWKPLVLEMRYELVKLVRLPVFAFMIVGFPVGFYLMFGVALAGSRALGGQDAAGPLLASYAAFGVVGASLFSFGVGVAVERAQGWLLLKRASPMPPLAYVLGKAGASMAFCGFIVVVLGLCAVFLAGVRLTPVQWVSFLVGMMLGSVPFCALGLAVGFWAGPNSAPGVVNVIHFVGAFAGGLWLPIEVLPRAVQAVAPVLPQYHLGHLGLSLIGQTPHPRPWLYAGGLLAWTVVAIGLAILSFKRDEGRLYG